MSRFVLGAIIALLGGASALYEDQAGKLDWYRQHVGTVLHSDFSTVRGRRLVFVSTDVAMVAALDAATGETVWRQPLPLGERIVAQAFSPAAGALLVGSIAADGSLMARRWALDGALLWDAAVAPPASGASAAPALALLGPAAEHAAVLWGAGVTLLRGATGEAAWAWASEGADAPVWHRLHLTADGATLVVYGRAGAGRSSALARAELSVAAGGAGGASAALVRSPSALGTDGALLLTLEPRFVVTLDAARAKLVFQADGSDGAHGAGAVRTAPLSALGGGGGEAELVDMALPGAVLLRLGPSHLALVDLTTGEPHARWEARAKGPIVASSLQSGGQAILACAFAGAGGGSVQQRAVLVTAGGAQELAAPPPAPLDLRGAHGPPATLFLGGASAQPAAGGAPAPVSQRALLVTRDGALHGLADGAALWTREEALARPLQLEFLELPRARDTEALSEGPQYGQLLRLGARLLGLGGGGGARRSATGGDGALVADAFGFRKLLLVRTAASKVCALCTDSGALAWCALPALGGAPAEALSMALVPAPGTNLETDVQLVVRGGAGARAGADADADGPAGSAADGSAYAVLTLDGLSGRPRAPAAPLPGRVVWSLRVPAPAPDGAASAAAGGAGAGTRGTIGAPPAAHAFVLSDLSVSLLPDTEAAARAFEAARASLYFYLSEGEGEAAEPAAATGGAQRDGARAAPAARIRGFGFVRGKGGQGFRAEQRWTFVPPPGALGLSLRAPDPSEAVHAPVQVLGDRGVLHKYLNRNLLAVGYTAPPAEGSGSAGSAAEPSVRVALLDGVSGASIYEHEQKGASGPVRLALTENTLVVQAQMLPSRAPLLSVIELYENATEPSILSMLLKGADEIALRPRSSFEARAPFALSSAFFLQAEIASLAFSQTARGITPRHLLLALHSGQMAALDKKLLDPRRPLGAPSTADREEGLATYSPQLGPIPLTRFLTYGHQVERVAGVRCAATTLESTTIVVLYGADLFVSRYSPARTFDMLAPEFGKVALALAVAALAVGTVVTTHLRRRQDLSRLWR